MEIEILVAEVITTATPEDVEHNMCVAAMAGVTVCPGPNGLLPGARTKPPVSRVFESPAGVASRYSAWICTDAISISVFSAVRCG